MLLVLGIFVVMIRLDVIRVIYVLILFECKGGDVQGFKNNEQDLEENMDDRVFILKVRFRVWDQEGIYQWL